MANTLQTIYFTKQFTSGPLKGLAVTQSVTGSPVTLAKFRKGETGRDIMTRDRWVITDASFQNYVR